LIYETRIKKLHIVVVVVAVAVVGIVYFDIRETDKLHIVVVIAAIVGIVYLIYRKPTYKNMF